jgi:hypothetical protein
VTSGNQTFDLILSQKNDWEGKIIAIFVCPSRCYHTAMVDGLTTLTTQTSVRGREWKRARSQKKKRKGENNEMIRTGSLTKVKINVVREQHSEIKVPGSGWGLCWGSVTPQRRKKTVEI